MSRIINVVLYSIAVLIAISIIKTVTETKFDSLREQQYNKPTVVSLAVRERQLDCLALNIYREAGNESFEGKVAVAQVTLNRVVSPEFPEDICGVVYEKNVFVTKTVCQFSWYCDVKARTRPIDQQSYEESYLVAKKVLLEGFRLDILNDALFYHADYVKPHWPNFKRVVQIGRHIYYTKA
jgi:spore germination cell wall hydrolase CwlJ-like protein